MTDGVYVDDKRPKTKKALKEAAKEGRRIDIECTSMFGGYSGNIKDAPVGKMFTVVGPDPYSKRDWFANIIHQGNGKVQVK